VFPQPVAENTPPYHYRLPCGGVWVLGTKKPDIWRGTATFSKYSQVKSFPNSPRLVYDLLNSLFDIGAIADARGRRCLPPPAPPPNGGKIPPSPLLLLWLADHLLREHARGLRRYGTPMTTVLALVAILATVTVLLGALLRNCRTQNHPRALKKV